MRRVMLALAVALSVSASAAARPALGPPDRDPEIEDAAGDANFLNDQGLSSLGIGERGPDTRPASIDSADLVAAWYETAYEVVQERDQEGRVVAVRHVPTALRVHVETAGPAAPSFGPTVSFAIWANVGPCSLIFRFHVRGPTSHPDDPPEGPELRTRKSECPEGAKTYTTGITLSLEGDVATLELPFAEVGLPGLPVVGPGDLIEADADGRRTYTSTVHRPQEGGGIFGGPTIDIAPATRPFVVGSDVPPDVDCATAPDHPGCLEQGMSSRETSTG